MYNSNHCKRYRMTKGNYLHHTRAHTHTLESQMLMIKKKISMSLPQMIHQAARNNRLEHVDAIHSCSWPLTTWWLIFLSILRIKKSNQSYSLCSSFPKRDKQKRERWKRYLFVIYLIACVCVSDNPSYMTNMLLLMTQQKGS